MTVREEAHTLIESMPEESIPDIVEFLRLNEAVSKALECQTEMPVEKAWEKFERKWASDTV